MGSATFRSLLESALRRVIDEHDRAPRRGDLPDARYGTGGVSPEYAEGGWAAIRDEIYPAPRQ